jgi:nucleoside-diphosphate-sugar epimerase
MKTLIFGCGYLGERVARRWHGAGHDVAVITRSDARAESFKLLGYRTILADVTRPETLGNLPVTDVALFSVGYDRDSVASITDVYAGGVRNVLHALPSDTGRFVYISTTGVYGPAAGDWVDETTPTEPQRDGGKASLEAERILAAHPLGSGSVILRLAGLYGPGRVPFIEDLRAGKPIAAPRDGFLNLIHVDDAASVVLAAARLAPFNDGPRVYCVSDGHPVPRGNFYHEVARKMGAPPPQFIPPDPHSPRAARAAANRRVRNDRMLTDLHVKLTHPDYRAGLAALLETQNQ